MEYLVSSRKGQAWFSKDEAIKLVLEGRLHAIVVHLRSGTNYLRPEHKSKPFELIV